jgi:hypothetical protein
MSNSEFEYNSIILIVLLMFFWYVCKCIKSEPMSELINQNGPLPLLNPYENAHDKKVINSKYYATENNEYYRYPYLRSD